MSINEILPGTFLKMIKICERPFLWEKPAKQNALSMSEKNSNRQLTQITQDDLFVLLECRNDTREPQLKVLMVKNQEYHVGWLWASWFEEVK